MSGRPPASAPLRLAPSSCASLEALKEVAAVELLWVWALPTMPSPQLPMLLALQGVHLQEAPLALQQRGLRLQIAAAPQWR